MSNAWWRVRLVVYMMRYGYGGIFRRGVNGSPLWCWGWSGESCWQMYREDGCTPREAIMEDLSYGL